MGFMGLLIGIIVAIIVLFLGDTPAKKQVDAEEELIQRIMKYGTNKQKMIALM
jgi:hypothetical protein